MVNARLENVKIAMIGKTNCSSWEETVQRELISYYWNMKRMEKINRCVYVCSMVGPSYKAQR